MLLIARTLVLFLLRLTWRIVMFAWHVLQWLIPIFGFIMWRLRVGKRRHRELVETMRSC
jgi:hypothetical protein